MALTDNTGAPVIVTREDGDFAIAVDGKPVGRTVSSTWTGSGCSITPRSTRRSAAAGWPPS